MQKVINYIKRCGGELITENERSHYFLLNKKVIRVSDHIGINSNGNMNIIVTPTNYLVWNRTTGDIDVVDYEDIKAFIRHANLLCAVSLDAERIDKLMKNTPGTPNNTDTILGYAKEKFTENQIKQIESYIKQIKK